MKNCIDYPTALVTFRDLCEPIDECNSEYVRGGINLMADLFGIPDMDTGERMDMIDRDLMGLAFGTPRDAIKVDEATGRIRIDMHGTRNPDWNGNEDNRFTIHGPEVFENDPEWPVHFTLVDQKYLDSDGLTITAVAGGKTTPAALNRAAEMIDNARKSDHCIF